MNKTTLLFALALLFAAPTLAQPPPPSGGGAADRLTDNSVDVAIATNAASVSNLTIFGDTAQSTNPILTVQDSSGGTMGLQSNLIDVSTDILTIRTASADRDLLITDQFGSLLIKPSSTFTNNQVFDFKFFPGPSSDRSAVLSTCGSADCLGLSTDNGSTFPLKIENDVAEIAGCKFHGKLSSAPSTPAECDNYWDTDLNLLCHYNGTNFVQADDWSTVCA